MAMLAVDEIKEKEKSIYKKRHMRQLLLFFLYCIEALLIRVCFFISLNYFMSVCKSLLCIIG